DLLPGFKAAPLERERAQNLPPRFDEIQVGGVFRKGRACEQVACLTYSHPRVLPPINVKSLTGYGATGRSSYGFHLPARSRYVERLVTVSEPSQYGRFEETQWRERGSALAGPHHTLAADVTPVTSKTVHRL